MTLAQLYVPESEKYLIGISDTQRSDMAADKKTSASKLRDINNVLVASTGAADIGDYIKAELAKSNETSNPAKLAKKTLELLENKIEMMDKEQFIICFGGEEKPGDFKIYYVNYPRIKDVFGGYASYFPIGSGEAKVSSILEASGVLGLRDPTGNKDQIEDILPILISFAYHGATSLGVNDYLQIAIKTKDKELFVNPPNISNGLDKADRLKNDETYQKLMNSVNPAIQGFIKSNMIFSAFRNNNSEVDDLTKAVDEYNQKKNELGKTLEDLLQPRKVA